MSKEEHMTDINNCLLNIKEYYKDKDPETLNAIASMMDAMVANGVDRVQTKKFIEKFAKENLEKTNAKMATILDTNAKHVYLANRLNDPAFAGDIKQAALSAFEQTSSQAKDAGINIENVTDTKRKVFMGTVATDLQKIGMLEAIKDGSLDDVIADVMFTGKAYNGPMADKVNAAAGIMKKMYKIMNRELNNSGLRVYYRDDYIGPVSHDGANIAGNFSKWVSDITDALDYAEEFGFLKPDDIAEFESLKRMGQITENSKNKVVQTFYASYKNIISEQPDSIKFYDDLEIKETKKKQNSSYKEALGKDKESRFLSISERRARAKSFTEWKSGADLMKYQRNWGVNKTLGEMFHSYANSASRDIGLATVLGGAPSKGYEMLRDLMRNKMGMLGQDSAQAVKDLEKAYYLATNPISAKVGGVGKVAMNFRQAAALAVLGRSGLTSFFLDPVASARQRRDLFNEGLVKSVWNTYSDYFPTLLDAEGRKQAGDMYLYMENEIHTIIEELAANGKYMNAASDMVAKYSLGRFFNRNAHITAAKQYLRFLHDADMNRVSEPMRADLEKFNITQADINIVKKLNVTKEGMRNINRITPDEFAELSGITDNADGALFDFQNKFNGWLNDKIKKGAPIPGRRERRYMYGNTTPGTREGELVRWFWQFKSTALKVTLDSSIGSARTRNPNMPQGGNIIPMLTNKNSMYYTGLFAAHMTTMGAGLILLNALSRGDEETLKRFEEGDPSLLLDAFSRGGGGMLLGDAINVNEDYKQNVVNLFSPAVGALGKLGAMGANVAQGDIAKATKTGAKTFIPAANHMVLDPFWSAMGEYSKKRSSKTSINYLQ